jgi:tripartite motif-containing protein 71
MVALAAGVSPSAAAPAVKKHGVPLSKRLGLPYDIEVGGSGNVFVSDWGYHRILKFSPTGKHLAQILTPRGLKLPPVHINGPASAALFHGFLPEYLAIDAKGQLWATANRYQVLQYSPAGKLLAHWVVPGANGLWVDGQGTVFVSQWSDNPKADGGLVKLSPAGKRLARWDTAAKLSGSVHHLGGLTVDSAGNVYVADFANDRIDELSPSGTVVRTIGPDIAGYDVDDSLLSQPFDVELDHQGNIYINDSGLHHFHQVKLSPSGTFIRSYPAGTSYISGNLAIDSEGNLYIASGNVVKESPSGQVLATWK